MAIDGALYPLHVAVSQHWKVHYFSADMAADAANRAEDGRFLADPAAVLGAPAMAALERIRAAIGLEYLGIDFALDARPRRRVRSERDHDRVAAGPDPMWDYRRAPTGRIVDAVRAMLLVANEAVAGSRITPHARSGWNRWAGPAGLMLSHLLHRAGSNR